MGGASSIICCFGVTYIEMQSWTLLRTDIVLFQVNMLRPLLGQAFDLNLARQA